MSLISSNNSITIQSALKDAQSAQKVSRGGDKGNWPFIIETTEAASSSLLTLNVVCEGPDDKSGSYVNEPLTVALDINDKPVSATWLQAFSQVKDAVAGISIILGAILTIVTLHTQVHSKKKARAEEKKKQEEEAKASLKENASTVGIGEPGGYH